MPVDVKDLIEDGKLDSTLMEEIENAQRAPEPGDIPIKKKRALGDNVSSAGYVYIYDNKTGQQSITNRNMLPAQLKKKREDGTRVFTVKDPNIPQRQGIIKCLLHKGDPNRKHYDEMGFAVCPMEHIPSPYQLELHMKKRHKHEYMAIERERQIARETEEREFQRSIIAMAQKTGNEERIPYIKDPKPK